MRRSRTIGSALLLGLLASGCASSGKAKRTLPTEAQLVAIVEYEAPARTWDTSVACAVYPMFGNEQQADSVAFMSAMTAGLEQHGYPVVDWANGEYMWHGKRTSAGRILRLGMFGRRSTALREGRTACDLHALVEVYTPTERGELGPKRVFDVWARTFQEGEGYVPLERQYEELVANLFRIASFREALEPSDSAAP